MLREYIDQLLAQRARDKETYTGPPPELGLPPDAPLHPHLHRSAPPEGVNLIQQRAVTHSLPIERVRSDIAALIRDYAYDDEDRVLLIRVPAGIGKTWMAIEAVQELANGQRVLYTASRHAFWDDLTQFPHFDREAWYHWLPIQEGDDERVETCRYSEGLRTWLKRGYPGVELCKQLCLFDKWMSNSCYYRQQAKQEEPVIFGMHQHLVYGMSIADYGMVVVDELPLHAFLERRRIPPGEIVPPGVSGPLGALFNALHLVVEGATELRGKPLLDLIGPTLKQIYEQATDYNLVLPEIPKLFDPDEVFSVAHFYWADLLSKLSPEFECWSNGWPDWRSRVRAAANGVTILGRRKVWEQLPRKVVVLDATGSEEVYRALFHRKIFNYHPQVERQGKIYQVVGRLNGSRQTLQVKEGEEGPRGGKVWELASQGVELLEACKLIAAKYAGRVGVVTFKKAVRQFVAEFGPENVMYYGALRGSNLLDGVECLIAAGGYCPPLWAIMDEATMLFSDDMEPFVVQENGRVKYPWRPAAVAYRLVDNALAWRYVSGFWHNHALRTVLEQRRQAELVQTAHRARPNLRPVDVWLLTSIPTPEALDGVYQDLSDTRFAPDRDDSRGVPVRHWLKLKPWLDERWKEGDAWVVVDDLAEVVGLLPATLRSQKWLHAISQHEPERWVLHPRKSGLRGRPRLGLLAVEA